MADPVAGTSLGRRPLKIQDTFTWEDLSHACGSTAEQARHSWSVNGIPTGAEAHFFEVHMSAFKEREKFTMVVSTRLLPYDYLIYSEVTSMRAMEAGDLVALALAYTEGLLGMPLAERIARRYGGKILEWLESVATMYEREELE